MTTDRHVESFAALSRAEKVEVLSLLAHELTVAAREGYEAGGDGLTDPTRVRSLNEVQHRVTGHLAALLQDTPRYPDEVLMGIILEHDESLLRERVERAMDRAFLLLRGCADAVAVPAADAR